MSHRAAYCCVWIIGGFVFPLAIFIMTEIYRCEDDGPLPGPDLWPVRAIEILFWIHVAYMTLGVWRFKEYRWIAVSTSAMQLFLAAWATINGEMAITGLWL
jgi:hypothetical protein